MSAKRVAFLAAAVVALIGLGMLLAAATMLWWRANSSPPQALNTVTIIQRVQGLSQLVTIKYVLEKVVVFEDPKFFADLIPLGENRITLLAHGEVKAGVDFSRLTPKDVSISKNKIILTLPRAIVTDAYLVEQQTRVLDWKTGLFRSFDKELAETARKYALAEIQRAARQSGIEDEAAARAKAQLSSFLQSLGFAEVEVRTRAK